MKAQIPTNKGKTLALLALQISWLVAKTFLKEADTNADADSETMQIAINKVPFGKLDLRESPPQMRKNKENTRILQKGLVIQGGAVMMKR